MQLLQGHLKYVVLYFDDHTVIKGKARNLGVLKFAF